MILRVDLLHGAISALQSEKFTPGERYDRECEAIGRINLFLITNGAAPFTSCEDGGDLLIERE